MPLNNDDVRKNKKNEVNNKKTQEMTKTYICNNKYTVYMNKLLGEGSFGKVYVGKNNETNELVAIKTESPSHNYLKEESAICSFLTNRKDTPKGFSKFYWFGEDSNKVKYFVCEPLGKSLQNLQEKCGGKFSLKTVLMIAFQLLNRIEFLHMNKYLHRDLKPSNLLIGLGEMNNTIYVVDFGLSKEYVNSKGEHIEYLKNRSYVGTIRYMSINSHKGYETSRRDDMFSYIYILFFMFFGNVPWQGINEDDKKKRLKIIQGLKSDFNRNPGKFYVNQKIPNSFLKILDYIRKMKFKQNVDYDKIREFLLEEMTHHKFNYDYEWDWIK